MNNKIINSSIFVISCFDSILYKSTSLSMSFSDDEYFEVIQKNKQVKEAFNSIKEICTQLHEITDCPEDDIDYFLKFIAGKWKK